MAQIATHAFHTYQKRASFPGTSSLFVGSFEDNMFCHGPQFFKPIDTSFITTKISTISKASSLTSSVISDTDDEDIAVLGDDDDEYSEDELPPSPKRRHSGAISISEEELPLCLDREALRRETAAHRERQHQHHNHHHAAEPSHVSQPLKQQRGRAGTFSVHDQWDAEIDGPSMALWVPEQQQQQSGADCKRRRTEKTSSSCLHKSEVPRHHHVSCIEGPMMCLWEA
ncbi:hypothetical protein VMCG_03259 [Cytospora schulzeri]|uniref:Uncharacterized protein n=1 Tax=Cytospora schulzeri TaxID=448051 RepID=A0A423WY85_9PEZI|nr:hypothetical protein VMCG_03259 [Valsa malicola]